MKATISNTVKKGFTLIELIVVIAILGALAGIAYPTIIGMQDSAKQTAASKVTTDIVQGVASFKSDYNGFLPFRSDEVDPDRNDQIVLCTEKGQDAGMIAILTNREDKRGEIINATQDTYLRSDIQESKKDGLYISDKNELGLYDPWGKPYYIILSYDDVDGCIDPFTKKPTGKECIVFSLGPDGLGLPEDLVVQTAAKKKTTTSGSSSTSTASTKKLTAAQRLAAREAADAIAEQIADNIYSWKKAK